ncbi:MAG: putative integral rane protein [Frankiales bacterium]|nr:putative integral rane protein [Frankiales bacterium]
MTDRAWHPREGRGVIPLRPLSVAEILDAPFAAIRRYLGPMLGAGFVVALLDGGGSLLWALWLRNAMLDRFGADGTVTVELALLVLALVVTLVAAGWQTALTGDALLGRDSSAAQVWATVRPRIGALILCALVAALPVAVYIGFIGLAAAAGGVGVLLVVVFFLPAVWLGVLALFLTPVVVLEGATVRTAVPRVFRLVRGSWWRCVGVLLVAAMVCGLVGAAVYLPFQAGTVAFLSGGLLDGVGGRVIEHVIPAFGATLSYALVATISAGVIAVLYVDIRIRTEAFDLTLTGAVPTSTPGARP